MGARWITYVNILYNIKQQDCCYILQNFNWINHNNMNSNYVSSLNWFRCDWVVYLKVYLFIWWDVNQRILSKDEFLFKLFDVVLKDCLMRLASYSSNTALVTFPPSVGSSILILGPRQTLECILVGSVFPVRTEKQNNTGKTRLTILQDFPRFLTCTSGFEVEFHRLVGELLRFLMCLW